MVVLAAPPPPPDAEVLARLEPEVRAWFEGAFPSLTPPQRHAVVHVAEGRNVLVSAPTGSGKTLAAFLAVLSGLVRLAGDGGLASGVQAVYVSPLKALANDIERNLQAPLAGIRAVFEAQGRPAPAIRVGIRTGDTSPSERDRQARDPPHVLVTTPESLALLLASPRWRAPLSAVRWVVVDEVHALAASKRGTHLALLLEELAARAERDPVRVGMSATVAPLAAIGAFLFGDRDGVVVDAEGDRPIDLEVACPVADPLTAEPADARAALDDRLAALLVDHATTIVFTNTRNATERVAFRLRERAVDEAEAGRIGAHHGSLSRETRLDVEERLKRGELRCVVTSTSLELGIDVGSVDCVALLGSPKGVSRALQRVGRSGHRMSAVSRGRFLSADRDDLVECLVLAREARARRVDPVRVPVAPLDVLAQWLVGLSLRGPVAVRDALARARRATPYRELPEEDLREVVRFLAGYDWGPGRVRFDPDADAFVARGRSRLVLYRNVGTIPSTRMVKVHHGARFVGELEEWYVEELEADDVLVLNGERWAFRHAAGSKAWVEPAPGRTPTVPRWGTETLPLPPEAAAEVARFREEAADVLDAAGEDGLARHLARTDGLDAGTAGAVARYFAEQARFARIPRRGEVLVEEHVDDEGRRVYVFHAALGRRGNEALARAFARTLSTERHASVGTAATDLAFALAVPRSLVLSRKAVTALFAPPVRPRLEAALGGSELAKRRFRHVAERALLLAKEDADVGGGYRGMPATKLWHLLRKHAPEHVVLRETWREVLEDALDLGNAERTCEDVREGRTEVRFLGNLRTPSPFAFHVVAVGSDDGVLLDDRRALLRELQERVLDRLRERAHAA